MNTEKIAYFILNPKSIEAADVQTIEDVKNKFPYCSTLHMLYMKGLANANSVHFEDQLKKSAIHVNDREKLHELIHSKEEITETSFISSQTEIEQETVVKEIEIVPTKIEEKKIIVDKIIPASKPISEVAKEPELNPISKKIVDPKPIVKPESKTDKVDMAKIIEDIRLKAEAARNKGKVIQPIKAEKVISTPKEEVPHLEEQIDSIEKIIPTQNKVEPETINTKVLPESKPEPAIATSEIFEKEEPETKVVTTEEKLLNIDVLSHAVETAFELDVDNIIRDTVTEDISIDIEELTPTEVLDVDVNTLSFTDWLKYKQGKLKVKSKETVKEEENTAIKLSKTEIDNLLNKFIEEEPKMARPQKEFYNPVKNAKKSLDDTTVLVSETLAKIYWMQKNYDKAIKAYEQLSLRNPEKKTFFANQIRKIKKELNKL